MLFIACQLVAINQNCSTFCLLVIFSICYYDFVYIFIIIIVINIIIIIATIFIIYTIFIIIIYNFITFIIII